MIGRILLPVNISRDWRRAADYGARIATAFDARLDLLYVGNSNRHREKPARWAPIEILPGKPSESIAAYARQINADVILMPTRGHGLLGQLIVGSVTMNVLRIADRPVWIAKPRAVRATTPFECRRIVCAVDLGWKGRSVLKYAARLATIYGAELVIVHAVPGISDAMLMRYGLRESLKIGSLSKAASLKVAAMASTIEVPNRVESEVGDVAAVLRRMANRWDADLLVVGGGRKMDGWRVGTNIGRIIAESPCPVVVHTDMHNRIKSVGRSGFHHGVYLDGVLSSTGATETLRAM